MLILLHTSYPFDTVSKLYGNTETETRYRNQYRYGYKNHTKTKKEKNTETFNFINSWNIVLAVSSRKLVMKWNVFLVHVSKSIICCVAKFNTKSLVGEEC